jgi:menaquinone C8-methyltransferase
MGCCQAIHYAVRRWPPVARRATLPVPVTTIPLVSTVLRHATARALTLEQIAGVTLPPPAPGRAYTLYLHVPFCVELCPYCAFNRFPFVEAEARSYFQRLRAEMRLVADAGYRFDSLYVGGGTPTVLLDELCDTLDVARELFGDLEVSCETNPDHLTARVVDALGARVHRLSVGVQSFDDVLLRQMKRYDKYGSGDAVFAALEGVAGRFPLLNVDLIFNFPSQTEAMLARDIDRVKDSGADQVTCYPLMASATTRRLLARTVGSVDHGREARLYHQICAGLADTFRLSSAWCFTRRGRALIDEYIVDQDEYVGLGSGAFSYLDGAVYANTFSLRSYRALIDAGRVSATAMKRFTPREQMRYSLLMGLFALHLDKAAFRARHGVSPERGLPLEMTFMRLAGAFERDDDVLTLTPAGRHLVVTMMREFFAGVNNLRDQARAALPLAERAPLCGVEAAAS